MGVKNMRELIALMESAEDDDGKPLEGSLNANALVEYLPAITDRTKFVSAVRKVIRNEEEKLNRWELQQLGLAFASLIRDDSQTKMKAIRRMMSVHLRPKT